jgi:hypothetical protein
LQLPTDAKVYADNIFLTFCSFLLAFHYGPKQMNGSGRPSKKAKNPAVRRCAASPHKAYAPLAGFLGHPTQMHCFVFFLINKTFQTRFKIKLKASLLLPSVN